MSYQRNTSDEIKLEPLFPTQCKTAIRTFTTQIVYSRDTSTRDTIAEILFAAILEETWVNGPSHTTGPFASSIHKCPICLATTNLSNATFSDGISDSRG
jgi:hypothetical protein